MNNPRIAVFHGGPGLSATYFKSLSRKYASKVTFEFHNPLGCDPHIISSRAASLDETLVDISSWFRTQRRNGIELVLAHSWGAFILFSLLNDAPDLLTDCRISLWNPVPLDKDTYDTAIARLIARVTPEASAEMGALGSTLSDGRQMMEIAWPFYSPNANRPADLLFDYFPEVFNSVNSGLKRFDYWSLLERFSSSTEIVFGSNDYIHPNDFARASAWGIKTQIVKGGHFPFVEDANVFEGSLNWLLS